MKALVLEDVQKFNLTDISEPEVTLDSVKVKVEAIGVCRSDYHSWQWGPASLSATGASGLIVLGHEISGTVVETGKNVRKFKKGDRVVIPFAGSDGTCKFCKEGKPHLCDNPKYPGGTYQGGYAEYVNVPDGDLNVEHLPQEVSFVNAAALGCRFVTAFHGVIDRAQVQSGENVVITGCGGVGLSAINIAAAAGANVIAVDINDDNLLLAKQMGADITINSRNVDVVEEIKKLTGRGSDLAVDALGLQSVIDDSIRYLKKGGRLLQIGIPSAEGGKISVSAMDLVMKELSVIGTLGMPSFKYDLIWSMMSSGKLDPGKMVTDQISLKDVESVFSEMATNTLKGTKVVTQFS